MVLQSGNSSNFVLTHMNVARLTAQYKGVNLCKFLNRLLYDQEQNISVVTQHVHKMATPVNNEEYKIKLKMEHQ